MSVSFRRRSSLSKGGRHRRRVSVVSCQHCGAQALETRVMCPACRRRLRPVVQPTALPPVEPAAPAAEPAARAAEPVAAAAEPAAPADKPVARPFRRRRLVYIGAAVAVAATLAAVHFVVLPSSHDGRAGALRSVTSTPSAATTPAAPKPHHYRGPLERISLTPPHGWKHEHKIGLPVHVLSKGFRRPKLVQTDLRGLGYRRGIDIEVYRPSPRIVVTEELWQFRTPDGANGWYLMFLRANQPHHGSTYSRSFAV